MSQKTIVLATGGTGGHVFPAQAIAEKFIAEKFNVVVVTDERGQRFEGWPVGVKIMVLPSYRRTKWIDPILKTLNIFKNLYHAWRGYCHLRPAAVIGFGSFASFVPVLAAWFRGIPCFIQEQNCIMGKAQRLLQPIVKTVFTSFKETSYVNNKKKFYASLPIRKKFELVKKQPLRVQEHRLHMLILGGSQGSSALGKVIPEALAILNEDERQQFRIIHQAREADINNLTLMYKNINVLPRIAPFFKDIEVQMHNADLIISRSGAGALFESRCLEKPLLLVPLRSSAHDHQLKNAQAYVHENKGWVIEEKVFSPQKLASFLKNTLKNPDKLTFTAKETQNLSAVDKIYSHIINKI